MSARAELPPGWKVERHGLTNVVAFGKGASGVFWSDGAWFRWATAVDGVRVHTTAPGIPAAATMDEAYRIGREWLAANADESQP